MLHCTSNKYGSRRTICSTRITDGWTKCFSICREHIPRKESSFQTSIQLEYKGEKFAQRTSVKESNLKQLLLPLPHNKCNISSGTGNKHPRLLKSFPKLRLNTSATAHSAPSSWAGERAMSRRQGIMVLPEAIPPCHTWKCVTQTLKWPMESNQFKMLQGEGGTRHAFDVSTAHCSCFNNFCSPTQKKPI